MRIGHAGHTRIEEIILAVVLLVFAVRTAIPTAGTVYGPYPVKLCFAVLIAAPGIWLLAVRTLPRRKRALLGAFITYCYCGVLSLALDWTRFAAAGAVLGLGALCGYLYYLTREEITWIQQQSSPSPPQDPESPATSSNA